ncbi:uncharacterized protein LOC111497492 [Cucurbita maxima]|uniref:Uncharacterized protein LOC111497492 n=1 Tax=Cucurbita maxima TaxID=3661 RepID=A0A6J1KV60_CUCMA|nr:uncharacterized protein LOC111497492 [Cucurbita maxima]
MPLEPGKRRDILRGIPEKDKQKQTSWRWKFGRGDWEIWGRIRRKKHHFSPVGWKVFICRGIVVDVTTKLSVAVRWDGNGSKISRKSPTTVRRLSFRRICFGGRTWVHEESRKDGRGQKYNSLKIYLIG